MKKNTLPLALLALAMPLQAQVRMDYEKLSQENGKFTSRFVLHNQTGEPLDADWNIYFSQLPMYPQQVSTPQLAFHTVLANYFRLSPTEAWKPLASGDSLVFSATFGGDLCRESYVPEGMFIVGKDGKPVPVEFHAKPFADQELTRDVEKNYRNNARLTASPTLSPADVLPSVKQSVTADGLCDLGGGFCLVPDAQSGNEARLLAADLANQHGLAYRAQGVPIRLTVDASLPSTEEEYYELSIRPDAVSIVGKSAHAVWNATRTLLALLRNPLNANGKLHAMDIKDWPDFAYRGQMIDIARNFTPYADLLKVVDALADYKLSVLHLHFCDDEGWRLEIPGLPELTEVGSRRGYTTDERDRLYPGYDGHYDPNGPTTGNGYLTRQQFIDLLRYAKRAMSAWCPRWNVPAMRALPSARWRHAMRNTSRPTLPRPWNIVWPIPTTPPSTPLPRATTTT